MFSKLDKIYNPSGKLFTISNFNSVLLLVIIGVISRLISLPPNFTPIGSIALFAAVTCKRSPALSVPLLIMLISDFMLGFDPIWYVYLAFIMISYIGFLFKRHYMGSANIMFVSLLSSIVFFIVTNFGVWLSSGFYSKDMLGLSECYYLAIPFFSNTIISFLFFNTVFFGLYYRLKDIKVKVLITT